MAIKAAKYEPTIGETIRIYRRNYFEFLFVCVEVDPTQKDCNDCTLDDERFTNLCKRCVCCADDRKDGKAIIFKHVENDNQRQQFYNHISPNDYETKIER